VPLRCFSKELLQHAPRGSEETADGLEVRPRGCSPRSRTATMIGTAMRSPLQPSTPSDSNDEYIPAEESWRRELRQRQSRWRASMGYPMGLHRGRSLGSRLAMPEAEENLWNFLTPQIGELVRREVHENAARPARTRSSTASPGSSAICSRRSPSSSTCSGSSPTISIARPPSRGGCGRTASSASRASTSSGHRAARTRATWTTARRPTPRSSTPRRVEERGSSSSRPSTTRTSA
jgi:hypothetical protein